MPQAKKSLGQHFLRCEWVLTALLESGQIQDTDIVLEIGPGTGVLTRALAKHARHVIAIEKDEQLAGELRNNLRQEGIENIEIIEEDILKIFQSIHFNFPQDTHYKVVANIPYYLTSRLIRLLLEGSTPPKVIALTIQKEVAERIIAKPPHNNLFSLSVAVFGHAEIIKTIPARCFSPQPKIDSAIIKISDISDEFFKNNDLDRDIFFKTLRGAFSHKRKLLINGLDSLYHKKAIAHVLSELDLSPKTRPQELSLAQWREIVKHLPRKDQEEM